MLRRFQCSRASRVRSSSTMNLSAQLSLRVFKLRNRIPVQKRFPADSDDTPQLLELWYSQCDGFRNPTEWSVVAMFVRLLAASSKIDDGRLFLSDAFLQSCNATNIVEKEKLALSAVLDACGSEWEASVRHVERFVNQKNSATIVDQIETLEFVFEAAHSFPNRQSRDNFFNSILQWDLSPVVRDWLALLRAHSAYEDTAIGREELTNAIVHWLRSVHRLWITCETTSQSSVVRSLQYVAFCCVSEGSAFVHTFRCWNNGLRAVVECDKDSFFSAVRLLQELKHNIVGIEEWQGVADCDVLSALCCIAEPQRLLTAPSAVVLSCVSFMEQHVWCEETKELVHPVTSLLFNWRKRLQNAERDSDMDVRISHSLCKVAWNLAPDTCANICESLKPIVDCCFSQHKESLAVVGIRLQLLVCSGIITPAAIAELTSVANSLVSTLNKMLNLLTVKDKNRCRQLLAKSAACFMQHTQCDLSQLPSLATAFSEVLKSDTNERCFASAVMDELDEQTTSCDIFRCFSFLRTLPHSQHVVLVERTTKRLVKCLQNAGNIEQTLKIAVDVWNTLMPAASGGNWNLREEILLRHSQPTDLAVAKKVRLLDSLSAASCDILVAHAALQATHGRDALSVVILKLPRPPGERVQYHVLNSCQAVVDKYRLTALKALLQARLGLSQEVENLSVAEVEQVVGHVQAIESQLPTVFDGLGHSVSAELRRNGLKHNVCQDRSPSKLGALKSQHEEDAHTIDTRGTRHRLATRPPPSTWQAALVEASKAFAGSGRNYSDQLVFSQQIKKLCGESQWSAAVQAFVWVECNGTRPVENDIKLLGQIVDCATKGPHSWQLALRLLKFLDNRVDDFIFSRIAASLFRAGKHHLFVGAWCQWRACRGHLPSRVSEQLVETVVWGSQQPCSHRHRIDGVVTELLISCLHGSASEPHKADGRLSRSAALVRFMELRWTGEAASALDVAIWCNNSDAVEAVLRRYMSRPLALRVRQHYQLARKLPPTGIAQILEFLLDG